MMIIQEQRLRGGVESLQAEGRERALVLLISMPKSEELATSMWQRHCGVLSTMPDKPGQQSFSGLLRLLPGSTKDRQAYRSVARTVRQSGDGEAADGAGLCPNARPASP